MKTSSLKYFIFLLFQTLLTTLPCLNQTNVNLLCNNGNETDFKPLIFTYKNNVYDLTEFSLKHPGGDIIYKTNCKDISEFWGKEYKFHITKEWKKVEPILMDGLIGPLCSDQTNLSESIP